MTAITSAQALEIKTILTDFSPLRAKTHLTIPSMSIVDYYAYAIIAVLALPAVLVWVLFSASSYPLFAIGALYMRFAVKKGTDYDSSWTFPLLCVLTYPYAALLYLFACAWWYFASFVIFFLSLPVLLIRVFLLCQAGEIANNFRLLYPWMKFNIFSYFTLARALLGLIHRQGLYEFLFGRGIQGGIAASVAYVVIIKYVCCCNPFLHILSEVYTNQWTPPVKTMEGREVIQNLRMFVSRLKHEPVQREQIDRARFAPHYPFGKSLATKPDGVIGAQFPEYTKIVCFTKTTHVTPEYRNAFSREGRNCRSTTGAEGVYAVELNWLSFHIFTGYVEANLREDGGVEHPMWCIAAKDSYMSMKFYSTVNDMFANLMPELVTFLVVFDENGELRARV